MRITPFILACSTLLAGPTSADELITKDGRQFTITKARKLEDGRFELSFKHGQILCDPRFVESVEIEGNMADYVPKDDRERENLEKGYVRHKGKWMSKNSYETLLEKEAEATRERLAELELHSAFRNGYELETRHFTFKSNASPELLEYYAELLGAYYKLMDNRVGIKPTPTLKRTKMHVNIYKSREDWNEHTSVGPGVVGFFSPSDQTLNFFHMAEDPGVSNWVSLHECTHLLTYLIQPTFQPRIWVNEGVADFFGSATIQTDKKGKLEIIPGKLQVERVLTVKNAIAAGKNLSLEGLFAVERDEFHSFEYSHAWSFVYFLNNTDKYAKHFKKFFKDFYTLSKKVDFEWNGPFRVVSAEETRRLLLDTLRVKDPEALETEWLTYIRDLEIDAPVALFKRGLATVMRGESKAYEEATLDLTTALEQGVEDPRLFWALGKIKAASLLKFEEGLELLEKAVELDPFNARFRASVGSVHMGMAYGSPKDSAEFQAAALESFGLASELSPGDDYYEGLLENARQQFKSLNEKRAK